MGVTLQLPLPSAWALALCATMHGAKEFGPRNQNKSRLYPASLAPNKKRPKLKTHSL